MYKILENGKTKDAERRNYRIYKNPEKVYDEYFCHGIEGRDELLEGIIFFSHNSEIARIQKTNYNKTIRDKSELERTIERAIDIYLQFYRFVDLNDRDKVPHYYHLENERDLRNNIETQIRNKIQQLQQQNDDYMFISNQERSQNPQRYDEDGSQRDNRIRRIKEEEQVRKNAEIKNKKVTRINSETIEKEIGRRVERKSNGGYEEEKENLYKEIYNKIYEEERKRYFDEKKITIKDDKIIYSARERLRYAHFPEGANPDNIQPYIVRHWTENVYDILSYLNNLEKEDKMKYYRIWLHTRIERLKNRGYIDDNVRKEIQELEEQVEKVKTLQKRREERKKKMEEIYKLNQEEEER